MKDGGNLFLVSCFTTECNVFGKTRSESDLRVHVLPKRVNWPSCQCGPFRPFDPDFDLDLGLQFYVDFIQFDLTLLYVCYLIATFFSIFIFICSSFILFWWKNCRKIQKEKKVKRLLLKVKFWYGLFDMFFSVLI